MSDSLLGFLTWIACLIFFGQIIYYMGRIAWDRYIKECFVVRIHEDAQTKVQEPAEEEWTIDDEEERQAEEDTFHHGLF